MIKYGSILEMIICRLLMDLKLLSMFQSTISREVALV